MIIELILQCNKVVFVTSLNQIETKNADYKEKLLL